MRLQKLNYQFFWACELTLACHPCELRVTQMGLLKRGVFRAAHPHTHDTPFQVSAPGPPWQQANRRGQGVWSGFPLKHLRGVETKIWMICTRGGGVTRIWFGRESAARASKPLHIKGHFGIKGTVPIFYRNIYRPTGVHIANTRKFRKFRENGLMFRDIFCRKWNPCLGISCEKKCHIRAAHLYVCEYPHPDLRLATRLKFRLTVFCETKRNETDF